MRRIEKLKSEMNLLFVNFDFQKSFRNADCLVFLPQRDLEILKACHPYTYTRTAVSVCSRIDDI